MDTVRTFVALELPEEVRGYLAELQTGLRRWLDERDPRAQAALKWVTPEGMHITLKFLGGVDASLLPALSRAVGQATGGSPGISLVLTTVGAFPSVRQPRVLWVGVDGELDALAALQRSVESALAQLGFAPEKRPFSPHLTMARVREGAGPAALKTISQLMVEGPRASRLAFQVGSVSLMSSELRRTGAIYRSITNYPLH